MKFGQITRLKIPKIIGYPIIAGLIGGLGSLGYYLGITKRDNSVELAFLENGKTNLEDSYHTKNICSLDLGVYGYDVDGISQLELKIDNRTMMARKNFQNVTEYTYFLNLCNSILNEGSHNLEVIMKDKNGNIESDQATLTIEGRVEWI